MRPFKVSIRREWVCFYSERNERQQFVLLSPSESPRGVSFFAWVKQCLLVSRWANFTVCHGVFFNYTNIVFATKPSETTSQNQTPVDDHEKCYIDGNMYFFYYSIYKNVVYLLKWNNVQQVIAIEICSHVMLHLFV